MKHYYIIYYVLLLVITACSSEVPEAVVDDSPRLLNLQIGAIPNSFATRADELHPGKTSWTLGDGVYTYIRFFDETGKEMTAFKRTVHQTMREVGVERHFVLDTEFDNTLPLNAKTVVATSFHSNDTTFTFSFDDNSISFRDTTSGYHDMVISSDTVALGYKHDTIFINSWRHPMSRIKVVSEDSTHITLKSINVPKTYSLQTGEFTYTRYKIVDTYCSTANDGFYEYDNQTGKTYCCAFFYGMWDKDEYILTYTGDDIVDALPTFVGKPSDASKAGVSYLIDLRNTSE